MGQLHNHCMSCCCHATYNIPFLYAQIKELHSSTRRLTRQSLYMLFVESTQDYSQCMGRPIWWHQCTCPKSKYIATRQLSHRSSHAMPHKIFLWCGGERVREEKEVVVSRNNHLMGQLHNHCMSCCCHATHNIPFYMHKLRDFIILSDDL
jgi:hypothetical protein